MSESNLSNRQSPTLFGDPTWLPKLLIWGAFIAFIYVLRDFFLIGFLTFLICFSVRTLVGMITRHTPVDQHSRILELVLTLSIFAAICLALYAVGRYSVPQVLSQYTTLVAQLKDSTAEGLQNTLLANTAGSVEFNRLYGQPNDPRFQAGLKKFQAEQRNGLGLYNEFPKLHSRLRSEFEADYEQSQIQHLNSMPEVRSASQGPFKEWFMEIQAPQLFHARSDYYISRWEASYQKPERAAELLAMRNLPGFETHRNQLIQDMIWKDVQNDPVQTADLRSQWAKAASIQAWESLRKSAEYQTRFRQFYEAQAKAAPKSVPIDYDYFIALDEAYPKGKQEFLKLVREHDAGAQSSSANQIYDFESATKLELGQNWWASSHVADWVRQHAASDGPQLLDSVIGSVERSLHAVFRIPIQIGTALLLSIFMLIEWDGIQSGVASLRETRLRPVYDEIAPAGIALGKLIGRSFQGQILISAINAGLIFLALWLIGIEYKFVLSLVVFLFSFIPVLGVLLSGLPMCAVAVLQPDGSLWAALQVVIAIAIVHLLEAMVFSPRIIGKIGELHPVLVIAILLVAEHFFGMWGLILGVPVAIYIIRVVILGTAIPGIYQPPENPLPSSAADVQ